MRGRVFSPTVAILAMQLLGAHAAFAGGGLNGCDTGASSCKRSWGPVDHTIEWVLAAVVLVIFGYPLVIKPMLEGMRGESDD